MSLRQVLLQDVSLHIFTFHGTKCIILLQKCKLYTVLTTMMIHSLEEKMSIEYIIDVNSAVLQVPPMRM